MGKKKDKRMARMAAQGGNPYGMMGAAETMGGAAYGDPAAFNGMGAGAAYGMGAPDWNAAGPVPGMNAGTSGFDQGLLHGFQGLLGSRQTEQFVLGALIGAAAVYVLGAEEIRNKLVKTGMKLYANVVGGFEEMKEQMADVRAEVEAEQAESQ